MILKEKDYRIEEDGIWISKKALEEVRDYYREVCKEHAKYLIGLQELILENVKCSTTY